MTENMSDYIPPTGWRVKGDDEVVANGDQYAYDDGRWNTPKNECQYSVGMDVRSARREYLLMDGYILTPIVSSATPQPDVSQESQNDDRSPLDVHLPEIERKINLASKDRPELLDWWRGAKEALAIEAVKRMGGAK